MALAVSSAVVTDWLIRYRGIIDRGDGDGHRGDIGVDRAIIHLEGKAVGSVVVQIWRVGQSRSCARECAVGWCGNDGPGQRIAIHIRCRQCDGFSGVFSRGNRLAIGHRGIVDRGDRDRHRGDVRSRPCHRSP